MNHDVQPAAVLARRLLVDVAEIFFSIKLFTLMINLLILILIIKGLKNWKSGSQNFLVFFKQIWIIIGTAEAYIKALIH